MVEITWRDCVQACDELLETLKLKMQQEPESSKFWQQEIAEAEAKRQEFLILAQKQEDAAITESIGHIFEHEGARHQSRDKRKHAENEIVPSVIYRIRSIEGSQPRESLAGGAGSQKSDLSPLKRQFFEEIPRANFQDV